MVRTRCGAGQAKRWSNGAKRGPVRYSDRVREPVAQRVNRKLHPGRNSQFGVDPGQPVLDRLRPDRWTIGDLLDRAALDHQPHELPFARAEQSREIRWFQVAPAAGGGTSEGLSGVRGQGRRPRGAPRASSLWCMVYDGIPKRFSPYYEQVTGDSTSCFRWDGRRRDHVQSRRGVGRRDGGVHKAAAADYRLRAWAVSGCGRLGCRDR